MALGKKFFVFTNCHEKHHINQRWEGRAHQGAVHDKVKT